MKIQENFLPAHVSIWQKYQPIFAAILLTVVCALPRWSPVELPGGQLFWKVAYGLFLTSSLIVLWPPTSRWLSQRFGVFAPERAPDAWWWFDVIVFTYTVIALTQTIVPLPRPPETSLPGLGGFPSGHEVSSWALAWLIWRSLPRLAMWWFGLAVLIGWARIATHDHYAYQVLSGAAVGIVFGWASAQWHQGVLLPRVSHWMQKLWQKIQR